MALRDRSGEQPLWRRYLRFWGPDVRRDVDDELALHLEMLEQENLEAGMTPEAARAAARRRFGDYTAFERECTEIGEEREKMIRRAERFSALGQDLGYVARALVKNPGFTLATVMVLALGLGASTAIFSVVDTVVLRPLGYAEPDRVVRVFETFPMGGGAIGDRGSVSVPNFEDWRSEARSFSRLELAGYTRSVTMEGRGGSERLTAVPVGGGLLSLLGVQPLAGRTFAPGEDEPGAPGVVVLSEQAWRTRFGADPSILGQTVTLEGEPHTIVGVMPGHFRFPAGAAPRDVWIPLKPTEQQMQSRGNHAFQVVGRLAPGATVEEAAAEMRQIAARIEEAYPDLQADRSAQVIPMHEVVVGRVQPVMVVLLGSAGLLLLIACANAASLLLARATSRRREVAIRTALGATRGRVIRQFLTESLTLAALGAAIGFFLAWASVRWISAAAGPLLPRATEISIDLRVVVFLVAIAALTGAVFGLVPALQTARLDVQGTLREGGRQGSAGRGGAFRSILVVTQIAVSIVLLVGAGLLMRTFVALAATDTGIATERVLTMKLALPGGRYETPQDAVDRFYTPMLERVRELPGVTDAGLINLLPLEEWGMNGTFGIVGRTFESASEMPFAEIRITTPGYFDAMGIPVLRGRAFTSQDAAGTPPVAVINRSLAERYFPGEDPIGQQLENFGPEPITIVGVVGDIRQARLTDAPLAELYVSYAQIPWGIEEMSLVVGTPLQPLTLVQPVRGAIADIDPQQPIHDVRPMSAVVAESVSDRRLYLWLLGSFAAVALALAITGIYGLVSYSVAQRTREFGIRLALGAGERRVSRMVVSQAGRLALLGIVIGIPAAYLLTRLLGALLYGVGAADPLTYTVVALALGGVALAAGYVPAARATRVDPMEALRSD